MSYTIFFGELQDGFYDIIALLREDSRSQLLGDQQGVGEHSLC
jgi:hypothetical protein